MVSCLSCCSWFFQLYFCVWGLKLKHALFNNLKHYWSFWDGRCFGQLKKETWIMIMHWYWTINTTNFESHAVNDYPFDPCSFSFIFCWVVVGENTVASRDRKIIKHTKHGPNGLFYFFFSLGGATGSTLLDLLLRLFTSFWPILFSLLKSLILYMLS